MENSKITLFWFRRDLRVEDNTAHFHTLNSKNNVLPILIFYTEIIDELDKDDSRITFIHSLLNGIYDQLIDHCSSVLIKKGNPIEILTKLISKYAVESVYANRGYEPYVISRDQKIKELLNGYSIEFNPFKNYVIFERNKIVKQDSTAYKMYTPYSKKWIPDFQELTYTSPIVEHKSVRLLCLEAYKIGMN